MKFKDAGARGSGGGRRPPPGGIGDLHPLGKVRPPGDVRLGQIRMEWMDPLSWRLPSGKALAEFALQAGFLAPLMLGGPRFKKLKKPASAGTATGSKEQFREVPGPSGSFREASSGTRETGFRETK